MKQSPANHLVMNRIISALSSSVVFWLIVGFFVLQAVWIAITASYPMAFDENFHLGIIKLYANHPSPFWTSVPDGSQFFGAIARDPSYLFHYLMSFLYRVISLFTSDETIQVLALRAICIGLFASGLVLFRKVILAAHVSKALAHSILAAFVLIPVVPLLAAQINYDNLLFPATGLVLLLALRINEKLIEKKHIPLQSVFNLASVIMLASLIKFAFLPIALVVAIFIIVRYKQAFGNWKSVRISLVKSWISCDRVRKVAVVIGLIISLSLFIQRYGVNIVTYHTPVPDCSQVLSVKLCSDYGPWIRTYDFHSENLSVNSNPLVFTEKFIYGMWYELYYSIYGPPWQYRTGNLAILPVIASRVVFISGLALVVFYRKRIFKNYNYYAIVLYSSVIAAYITVLWIYLYREYLKSGQPVALHGRYLIPILLPLLVVFGLGFRELLIDKMKLKVVLLITTIICLSLGGGALTYILQSSDDSTWSNPTIRTFNHATISVLKPLVPMYKY